MPTGSDGQGDRDTERRPEGQKVVLRPPRLVVPMEQELANILATQKADAEKLDKMMAAASGVPNAQVEIAKLQAATSLDLRKDIASVDKFTGEVGELNHFLRSGEGITLRIGKREEAGRLDAWDAQSLRGALIRRISRRILNLLQVDESTPWPVVRERLQKEYGGGRWTPEEDALRMLRMVRGAGQTRGDFAAQLLAAYQGVVDKFRETQTASDAAGKLLVIEGLALAQLGEAAGRPLTGRLMEAANTLIDAAGRGEEEPVQWTRERREWAPAPRRREGRERRTMRDASGRKEEPRRVRAAGQQPPRRRTDDRRCFGCGKQGHLQAQCSEAACFQCGGRGHFARACPYRPPARRGGVEPMEVNMHRTRRHTRSRAGPQEVPRDTDDSRGTEVSSSESETEGATYAAVVKKGKGRPAKSRRAGSKSE